MVDSSFKIVLFNDFVYTFPLKQYYKLSAFTPGINELANLYSLQAGRHFSDFYIDLFQKSIWKLLVHGIKAGSDKLVASYVNLAQLISVFKPTYLECA